MEIDVSPLNVAQWFSEILRASFVEEQGAFVFSLRLDSENFKKVSISIERISHLINALRLKQFSDETSLYDDTFLETAARSTGLPYRADSCKLSDSENGVDYELSEPSDEYIVFLLHRLSKIGPVRTFFRSRMSPSMILRRVTDEAKAYTIFDIVRFSVIRHSSIRIKTQKKKSYVELSEFVTSFTFHLSYNLDAAIVPIRYFEEAFRFSAVSERRSRADEMVAPRRLYVADLVYHYQMAVSAEGPFLEYISYYHVFEHFFESIFQDDLIDKVKSSITHPDFSYKRKKDIQQLIKHVSGALKFRNENVTFSEHEALKLTLARFIDVSELKRKITEYDSTLTAYYSSTQVPFAAADKVDFDGPDHDKMLNSLASRIYKTRNALVHSKDGDRSRYTPFRDDRELIKEIPLLRYGAEQIIIKNSKPIE
jgi:hypothetical protein